MVSPTLLLSEFMGTNDAERKVKLYHSKWTARGKCRFWKVGSSLFFSSVFLPTPLCKVSNGSFIQVCTKPSLTHWNKTRLSSGLGHLRIFLFATESKGVLQSSLSCLNMRILISRNKATLHTLVSNLFRLKIWLMSWWCYLSISVQFYLPLQPSRTARMPLFQQDTHKRIAGHFHVGFLSAWIVICQKLKLVWKSSLKSFLFRPHSEMINKLSRTSAINKS